jgi:hypothetical protein
MKGLAGILLVYIRTPLDSGVVWTGRPLASYVQNGFLSKCVGNLLSAKFCELASVSDKLTPGAPVPPNKQELPV